MRGVSYYVTSTRLANRYTKSGLYFDFISLLTALRKSPENQKSPQSDGNKFEWLENVKRAVLLVDDPVHLLHLNTIPSFINHLVGQKKRN